MTDRSQRARDASEAFDLVADDTRFAIIRALWDLTDGYGESVSFATLRESAGVYDSGQFNYHLGKLRPQFVRKVEDGYRLTEAGRRIVGAVVSGVYTDLDVSLDPRRAGDCPLCDGGLELTYENGVMAVECHSCERHVMDMSAPPVLVGDADPGDTLETLNRHALTEIQRMSRGFCVYCNGPLDVRIETDGDGGWSGSLDVTLHCEACRKRFSWDVVVSVLDHSAVIALFHEAGTDIRETPVWELLDRLDATVRVDDEEPFRIETTVRTDDAELVLVLDDDLDVVDTERRSVERE